MIARTGYALRRLLGGRDVRASARSAMENCRAARSSASAAGSSAAALGVPHGLPCSRLSIESSISHLRKACARRKIDTRGLLSEWLWRDKKEKVACDCDHAARKIGRRRGDA